MTLWPNPRAVWLRVTHGGAMDLEKFFDRVDHDVLKSRVARRVKDKRLLKLIRAFLTSGCR